MGANRELPMIVPLNQGKARLVGAAISCTCCPQVIVPPPPPPTPPPPPPLNILMATATSAGGGLSCVMGPVVKTFEVPPPYLLVPRTYQLAVEFTTGDGFYHQGSFYEMALEFNQPMVSVNWVTTHQGAVGNPWVITNAGKGLRYNVEDSENCGGTNPNIQTGMALATIVITTPTLMGFDFQGNAELQSSGYENISFYLRSA
jgi:hypothetical protein